MCVFCTDDIETAELLFISCSHTQLFWKQFMEWLNRKIAVMPAIDHNSILFGVLLANKTTGPDDQCRIYFSHFFPL